MGVKILVKIALSLTVKEIERSWRFAKIFVRSNNCSILVFLGDQIFVKIALFLIVKEI